MRTTLDLDDDVLRAARALAARERRSLGAVVSALARQSLQRRPAFAARAPSSLGGRFAMFPLRDEVITVEHVRGLMGAQGV
jgi:hypothetical protein